MGTRVMRSGNPVKVLNFSSEMDKSGLEVLPRLTQKRIRTCNDICIANGMWSMDEGEQKRCGLQRVMRSDTAMNAGCPCFLE